MHFLQGWSFLGVQGKSSMHFYAPWYYGAASSMHILGAELPGHSLDTCVAVAELPGKQNRCILLARSIRGVDLIHFLRAFVHMWRHLP